MLASEVRSLRPADELFTNSDAVVTFEGGPFADHKTNRFYVVVRYPNGSLSLESVDRVRVKPPTPKAGETWKRRNRLVDTRYVVAVTDSHVITKSHAHRPDSAAHLYTLEDFLKTYRP